MRRLPNKWLLSIVLLAVLPMLMMAGGQQESGDGEDDTLKAAMVLNGPVSDGGWNQFSYQGLVEAKEKHGYEIAYSDNVKQSDYVAAFREYANQGYDLIVAPGFEFTDAIKSIYKDYPDTFFAGINCGFTDDNVASLNFHNVKAGFAAGALAGMLTETNVVSYIGGMEIPPITEAQEGMANGLSYTNSDAKLVTAMAGSWSDMAKGKEIALSQISTAKVDVFFPFASAVNIGVIEGAKEKGAMVIGEPMDQLEIAPDTVMTSVIMSNPQLVMIAADMVVEGNPKGEYIVGDFSNGVFKIGKWSNDVPQDIRDKMEEIVNGIISGDIDVDKKYN